jgi:hypothetical protein
MTIRRRLACNGSMRTLILQTSIDALRLSAIIGKRVPPDFFGDMALNSF